MTDTTAEALNLTEQTYQIIERHGPKTADELYAACDAFQDKAHCSRVLAQMATREPVRLLRRKVPNPSGEQTGPREVYQYDTAARAFGGVAATSMRTEPRADLVSAMATTHDQDQVPAKEAAGEQLARLRDQLHGSRNEAAAYRLLLDAVMARIGATQPEAILPILEVLVAAAAEAADLAEQQEEAMPTHPLTEIFDDVVRQVTQGKGKRHGGDDTPFLRQPWVAIADSAGNGFLVGQGIKKAMEAGVKDSVFAWETEVLGAIAYLAMAVLHGRWKHRERVLEGLVEA